MTSPDSMKIAELARVSGAHRSTIHHYLNVGLLPRPRVVGPRLHWFGAEHVAKLRDIQALRDRGWSLARIRAHLARVRDRKPDAGVGEHDDSTRQRIVEHATS